MERTSRHEKNMIRLYSSVLGLHRRPFHNGKDIPLHPFTGYVGPAGCTVSPRNLIDFINKNNAPFFGKRNRPVTDNIHIHHLFGRNLRKNSFGHAHCHFPLLHLFRHHGCEYLRNPIRLFIVRCIFNVSFFFQFHFYLTVVQFAAPDTGKQILSSLPFPFI